MALTLTAGLGLIPSKYICAGAGIVYQRYNRVDKVIYLIADVINQAKYFYMIMDS